MEYKNLGRTGLKVSAVGLGCGNFGGIGSAPAFFGKGETEEEAFALMDAAWEMGINFFDTADAYGGGRSETYIGTWLKAKGAAVRDQLLLSSKVFNPVGDGPNDRGLSRRHILRQVEASLRRLGVDHLDMYLIHETRPDHAAGRDAARARRPGAPGQAALHRRVEHAGLADDQGAVDQRQAQSATASSGCRTPTACSTAPTSSEMFPLCADQGLGYTPFSPLAGGWLTGKYQRRRAVPGRLAHDAAARAVPAAARATESFDGLDALRAHAAERGADMAALALAWVMAHPLVTAPILGPRRPEHLDPAKRAIEIKLTAEERRAIAELFANDEQP